MSALATPAAEAPELEAAPAEAPETSTPDSGAEVTFRDLASAFAHLDRSGPQQETTEPEPEPEPAPEPEPEASGDSPVSEGEGDGEGEGEEPAPKTDPRIRINPKNFDDEQGQRDYAAIELVTRRRREGKPISVVDAYRELFGDPPAASAVQESPEAEATPAATEPTVESIEARLAAIEVERKQAEADFDLSKLNALNDEKLDLRDQRRELANRQQTVKQTEAQRFDAALSESYGRVIGDYPDAADQTSAFSQALDAEVKQIAARNPAFFADPEWPELLAPKVAKQLGKAPVAAPAAAPAAKPAGGKPAIAPAAKPVVRPASRTAPAPAPGRSSPAPSVSTAPEKPATFDELKAAMREAEKSAAAKPRR